MLNWIIPPILLFGFSLALLAIGLLSLLLRILGAPSLQIEEMLGYLVSGVVTNLLFGAMLNLATEVCVGDQGFYIRVFVIKRVFVPWEDLLDLRLSLRFDRNKEMVWVVQVRRLTLWHRFVGLSHGTGWTPSFVITSDMDGYRELRKTLESHLEQP
jgi:hypothetical protein